MPTSLFRKYFIACFGDENLYFPLCRGFAVCCSDSPAVLFVGLDFVSTEALYSLISGYKKYGTVLFSSHILESVTLTSDRVLVLENGVIAKTFTGDEINAENIRQSLGTEDNTDNV